MTWPTVAVNTTNTDSSTDSPVLARADILDLMQKFNQAIAHVSAFVATVFDDADAAAVRSTIGAQASDADLTALAALASTGIAVRSAADTWVQRAIAGTANQITLTNGDGVAGNPTVSLPAAITLPGSLTMGGLLSLGANGQIQFPATQNASADANCLDDYEEGNWTPSVGGSATYTTQEGKYVKIGRLIIVTGRLGINVLGTGSQTEISGLPFTNIALRTPVYVDGFSTIASNVVLLCGRVNTSATTITLQSLTAAGNITGSNAIFQDGAAIDFAAVYHV